MITKKNKFYTGISLLLILLVMATSGCKKDAVARKTVYQLTVKDQLGISGTVTFTETSNAVTTIDIALVGGDATNHPAFIQLNSAVEGGLVAVTLSPVVSGKSTTQVSSLDNGSAINYAQLIVFNGYINVDESSTNLATIIAQCDIGGNVITTTNKTYTLSAVGASGVSGTALFQKRNNGNTLVSIVITGGLSGASYPATINIGSVSTVGGGPVVKTLNTIDGTSEKSYTNISKLDDGTSISYDNLMVYDGYLAVYQTIAQTTVLCEGNIGTH